MTYKYDVFISYSRKDYKDEATKAEIPGNAITAITEAFDKNNISYWIDRDGIYSGQEFENIIIDAIDSSRVFLFVSSSNSNESKWTKSEIWEAFEEDKYIIPFKIENIDYHKNLKFKLRPLDFIEYFSGKDEAIQDLVRSVNQYKEELAKEEKKQLEEKLKAEIAEKIKTLEDDFKISIQRHEVTLKEILELHAKLGTTTKICPICDKKVPIETAFCERCGWQFPALLSSEVDRKRLTLLKANWKIINTATTSKDEIKALKNKNQELKETIDIISLELEEYKEENAQVAKEKAKLNAQIQDLKETIDIISLELEEYKEKNAQVAKEKAKLNAQIQDLKVKIQNLNSQIDEKGKLLLSVNAELSNLTKQFKLKKQEHQSKITELERINKELAGKYAALQKINIDIENKYKIQIAELRGKISELTNSSSRGSSMWGIFTGKRKITSKSYIYNEILPLCKVDRNTNLFPSDNKNVINLANLISLLKEDYGVTLTTGELNKCKRVDQIIDLIAQKVNVQ